ncbi:MAG: GAF domain-containing protein, partial [Candidatus Promineifilaceae bacterium]
MLAIPLTRQSGELIGLLRVDNKKGKNDLATRAEQFSKEDEWILHLFADKVVASITASELMLQLGEQKDHRDRLIASSPDGVVAIDSHGQVNAYNPQAQTILKYTPEEVLGAQVDFLYADPQEPTRIGALLRSRPDGKLDNYETFVRSKSGEQVPIRLSVTWLYDGRGRQVGSVGYFEDLRVIKDFEQRVDLLLRASNIVAQARNLTDGLHSLAQMLTTLMETAFCRVYLLSEKDHLLLARSVYLNEAAREKLNWHPELEENILLPDRPALAEFLRSSTPTLIGAREEENQPLLQEWFNYPGVGELIQSLVLIPLRTRDRLVGLLCLGDWKPVLLPEGRMELASAIANQTAVLIDQIHLHELAERHRQLLITLDEASRNIRAVKETARLLQEVVRLGAELVNCTAGGLFINQPYLNQLELAVTYKLPDQLIGSQLPNSDDVVGAVIHSGRSQIAYDYSPWSGSSHPNRFSTFVAVPLKQADGVEAVLFVGSSANEPFLEADLEILERFAVHASLALQTSRLVNQEQRMLHHLTILHRISDYIQSVRELGKILHIVLTGVTAGFGLGFNRAGFFMVDDVGQTLLGRLGIGYLDEQAAYAAWDRDMRDGRIDLRRYLSLLAQEEPPPTPIHERINGLRIPLKKGGGSLFSEAIYEEKCILVGQNELAGVPDNFLTSFEPALPFVIVPLLTSGRAIGLLVVDNKFTRSPITDESVELLFTFVNTAAIAINNIQLFEESKKARDRMRASFEASNTLIAPRQPNQVLQDIVEQARVSASASWVSIVLIDEAGQAQELITSGIDFGPEVDIRKIIRPDGITMQVMRSGRVEIINDTTQQSDRLNPVMLQNNVGAALCLPLALQGRQIGVMWVHYEKQQSFHPFEVEALQLYVNQASIAYD